MSDTQTEDDVLRRDHIEAIAARLDLRQPNKEALESIAYEITRHFEIDGLPPPFEAVADVATGVGKTYVLAAAIDYLAVDGIRNFAVIVPGRTILSKTVANFTPGHAKSLLGGMDVRPVVITSDNFATAAMRASMDDPAQVKLFIFTVQALLRPSTKVGRKTHTFQEGLGAAFYTHLQELDDLVVFADEHHAYFGQAFSTAVRGLSPHVLLGLTATPHRRTPPDQIIFRYPLAAAIADNLVKTPVLVGRKDDRSDPETKLRDGVRLLEVKEQAINRWCAETRRTPITPIMLVIASSIAEANEIEAILRDPAFAQGRYTDAVLTVHSDAPDEALAQLDGLEAPDNPYRIVISVGMLKEGWDVKNVYVIASMRASVSEILTEQTLGRGLRLPFGTVTGIEILDTLEVLGHERYYDLLRKSNVLNEQFIDRRTRAVLRRNAEGQLVPVVETSEVQAPLLPTLLDGNGATQPTPVAGVGRPLIQSIEDVTQRSETQLERLQLELIPREDAPLLRIPQLKMSAVKNSFSLADITGMDAFRILGERLAADPSGSLNRVAVRARIIQGADGLRHTELVTSTAADRVASPAAQLPLNDARRQLIQYVLSASIVPARAREAIPAANIVDALLRGLGDDAEHVLSGSLERAAGELIQLVTAEQRRFATAPAYEEVVSVSDFAKLRLGRAEVSQDRFGAFRKGVGYQGYRKSLYAQDWFDSSPERDVANILDDGPETTLWVRLQNGDLPILWSTARSYNPDFIATTMDGAHWVIEVKMDKEVASQDVQAKRQAAQRWANHVSADPMVGMRWNYLLVSESDVRGARGSWGTLQAAGR